MSIVKHRIHILGAAVAAFLAATAVSTAAAQAGLGQLRAMSSLNSTAVQSGVAESAMRFKYDQIKWDLHRNIRMVWAQGSEVTFTYQKIEFGRSNR
jgi:hypothetical protein